MADTKVSAFTAASALDGTEEIPVLQAGNKRSPISAIATYLRGLANTWTGAQTFNAGVTANALTLGGQTVNLASSAQGDILIRNATEWARLAAGTSGQFLKTQGAAANPVWDTPAGGGTPGGADTQIQFNDAGVFGGDAGLVYNKTTDILTVASAGGYAFNLQGSLRSSADGVFNLLDNAGTSFGRLTFGGTSSSFPALKRSSATLQVRVASDTAYADLWTGSIVTDINKNVRVQGGLGDSYVSGNFIQIGANAGEIICGVGPMAHIYWPANGVLQLTNGAGTDFGRLQFGGTSSAFPSLKRSTTELQARLADDSDDCGTSSRYHRLKAHTVATLPSAATAGQGATAYVTDATQTIVLGLGNVVAGGGSNKTTVFSDGTNWIIG